MISSTRAEIGVYRGMVDSLGRILSGLVQFCTVARFSGTARRNRAELWSGLDGSETSLTRAVAAAGTYVFSPPSSSEGECSTWNIRSLDLSLSQTRR
jgi:hypothetical protein